MNSRGRIHLLENFLEMFYLRTEHLSRVNLYIRIDNDDIETLNFIKKYERRIFKQKVNWVIEDHLNHMNNNMNLIALNNDADFYWGVNNDTEIVSNNWDLILDDYIEEYGLKNKIAYLYIDDDATKFEDSHGCCFPIISKPAISYMRCMFPMEIPANGADGQLYKIYNTLCENRIYNCPKLAVYHYCHHNKRVPADDINANIGRMSTKGHLEKDEFARYVNGLNQGIKDGY